MAKIIAAGEILFFRSGVKTIRETVIPSCQSGTESGASLRFENGRGTLARTKRVALIVINYRTPELVVDCLQSFEAELDPSKDYVTVVDNASEDGSADLIEQAIRENGWNAWCEVIRSPANGGFPAGNNLGMGRINADYYWLTNSDTLCRPGALEGLLKALQSDERVGLAAPRLEWPDSAPQVSCFRYGSPFAEFVNAAGTGPITKLFRRYNIPQPVSETVVQPDWVSFASVLIRREVIEDIGVLDEGFFMFFEDVDYCRRARRAGWRILYCPSARVVHLRGGSSPVKTLTEQRRRRPRYYYASRSRYLLKFYGRTGLLIANLFWLSGHAIAVVRETLGTKMRHACDDEWKDIWTDWRTPLEREPE